MHLTRSLRAGLAAAGIAVALASCGAEEPKTAGTPPAMRRLTEDQFRNSIADAFGADIKIGGKLEPLVRTGGLVALGAQSAAITPSGMEKIHQLAKSISAQVVDPQHRGTLVACGPADAKTFDEACAAQFFARSGKSLFRRPLADAEMKTRMDAARTATAALGDFYLGLGSALTGMLISPNFLYLIDTTEPDPAQPGGLRLDAYAKATRLSYFLWNTAPDDALLDAAAKGELQSDSGLARQVDRMLTSVRLEGGLRGFFADALAFDQFDTLEKDSIIYPAFNLSVAELSVLSAVGHNGSLSPTAIAEQTSMDKARVSRASASLVAQGMLRQSRDPSDGRGRLLRLTKRGTGIHNGVVPVVRDAEAELTAGLGKTELAALTKALNKLSARLDTIEQGIADEA